MQRLCLHWNTEGVAPRRFGPSRRPPKKSPGSPSWRPLSGHGAWPGAEPAGDPVPTVVAGAAGAGDGGAHPGPDPTGTRLSPVAGTVAGNANCNICHGSLDGCRTRRVPAGQHTTSVFNFGHVGCLVGAPWPILWHEQVRAAPSPKWRGEVAVATHLLVPTTAILRRPVHLH